MVGLRGRVLVAYLIVCVVWGSTYLAIRVGVTHVPPFLFGGARFLLAGAVLGAVALWRGERLPRSRKVLGALALLGALFFLGGNGGVVWAEQFVPSGLASIYVVTVALWTAGFDALLPGRKAKITTRVVLGLVLGLLGSMLLVGVTPGELMHADLRGPIALTLGSASWALATVYGKRLGLKAPVTISSAVQMLSGGALMLGLGLAAGEQVPRAVAPEAIAAFGYLVVFGSILTFTAYIYLLRHASPTVVGTAAYINPMVAVLLGSLILDEPFTPRTLLAMGIILTSVLLIQLGTRPARKDQAADTAAGRLVEHEA
jgi:drug/metabolite transporter (DMT)-like permease